MTRPALSGMVRKEMRALGLAWTGTAAACVLVAVADQPRLIFSGRLAYFLGSVALAAMSVGHEYTHGTLPVLLSLPVDRRRLIIAKLLAVLPMLGSLALLTLTIGPGGPSFERGNVVGGLSVLAAGALAPWLTMLCRNPLAGGVFALGLTGMLHFVSLEATAAWVRLGGSMSVGMQTIYDRVLVASLIAASLLGAVAGWRAFMRLEAAERHDTPLAWPRWLRSRMVLDEAGAETPAQRSHPLWLLVKKEVRLQQLSIAVAVINVLIWAAVRLIVSRSEANDAVLAAVGAGYGTLLAVVIGGVASASERQMGTLSWQQLLPFAAWQQWVVKTGVVVGLSLVLAFALPVLLARGELGFSPAHAGVVIILTIGSMFVSSLCRSSLQAIALSAPALLMAATLLAWSMDGAEPGAGGALAVATGVGLLAWWLAFVNHRTARS